MKICSKCRQEKPLSGFYKNKKSPDGHAYSCKECKNKVHLAYMERAGEEVTRRARERRHERPEVDKAYQAKYRQSNRARGLVRHAKNRAIKMGIPFDLDARLPEIQSRVDAGKCELTGLPFEMTLGRVFNSPSIDRIVPKEGYVYSNIRIICHAMNCALGDWGEEKLLQVLTAWRRQKE